jgi:hypothetical protein
LRQSQGVLNEGLRKATAAIPHLHVRRSGPVTKPRATQGWLTAVSQAMFLMQPLHEACCIAKRRSTADMSLG